MIDYGVLESDANGQLTGFREKPKTEYEVSMGVYMVNREILQFIPHGVAYGFDTLMLDLITAGREVKVENYLGYWLDIGRPDDYAEAIEQFDAMKSKFIDG